MTDVQMDIGAVSRSLLDMIRTNKARFELLEVESILDTEVGQHLVSHVATPELARILIRDIQRTVISSFFTGNGDLLLEFLHSAVEQNRLGLENWAQAFKTKMEQFRADCEAAMADSQARAQSSNDRLEEARRKIRGNREAIKAAHRAAHNGTKTHQEMVEVLCPLVDLVESLKTLLG